MDYKSAGVDIEAGYKSVELMKEHVKKTMRPEVLTNLGGFSGAFSMEKFKDMEKPTLVSGTDGVGTKLKLAFLMDKHDTVGIDCVAMCVNDIACAGGEPLFFLDYIACGKNYPEKIAEIVSGVAEGCQEAEAALIGGETAEMPGFYPEDEYDLAGFAVGVVDEKDIISGRDLAEGDVLIGIASSGVHSNGFSLVRKVFEMTKESLDTYYDELGKTLGEALIGGETAEMPGFYPEDEYDLAGFAVGVVDEKDIISGRDLAEGDVLIGIASSGVHSNGFSLVRKVFEMTKESLDTYYDELGKTLGEALLEPTKIYVKALKSVKKSGVRIKACSHITGGGFYENIPRMLKEDTRAVVKKDSYEVPAIFKLLQKTGDIDDHMMYNTYNMGIGMVIAVDPGDTEKALAALEAAGETAYEIGIITVGEKGVALV